MASLSRLFGPHNIDLAEDVVQDALEAALQSWKFKVPDNPAAWLTRVVRNRALDVIRHRGTERKFAAEYLQQLDSEWMLAVTVDESLTEIAAAENQIRMMYTICQANLGEDTHVTLILKFLCGFSTHEIAAAYLTSDTIIDKRLQRGRSALKKMRSLAPQSVRSDRECLGPVLAALYLLFSEGYHGSHPATPVRSVLCEEAMRLCAMLTENAQDTIPAAHALMALMYLNFARLDGRLDHDGLLLPLEMQDRSGWNRGAIERGLLHLSKAAKGTELSRYHLEAGISSLHSVAPSVEETNWPEVCRHYDLLYEQNRSPVVAVCRALAMAMMGDTEKAVVEIIGIGDHHQMLDYPFYWAARGEIHARAGHTVETKQCFSRAAKCARNLPEQNAFLREDWWGRARSQPIPPM